MSTITLDPKETRLTGTEHPHFAAGHHHGRAALSAELQLVYMGHLPPNSPDVDPHHHGHAQVIQGLRQRIADLEFQKEAQKHHRKTLHSRINELEGQLGIPKTTESEE